MLRNAEVQDAMVVTRTQARRREIKAEEQEAKQKIELMPTPIHPVYNH